jgi:dolichol kinase
MGIDDRERTGSGVDPAVSDALQAVLWISILAAALAACVVLRRWGVPATYVRDVLHIAAGGWVLGWPGWNDWLAPSAITWAAAAATASVPLLASRSIAAAAFRDSVSGGDEGWTGLVLYTLAFAVLTSIGIRGEPFPPAAGLSALCFGDGIGGMIGRRYGRRSFAIPGAKPKSVEGTLAVALSSAVAIAAVGAWLGHPVAWLPCALLGAVAATAEAVSPRSSDNVLVPSSVFAAALALS